MTPAQVTVGLLGDVMLGRGVARELALRPPESVWSDGLRSLAADCDVVICNLECCISARGEPTDLIPGKPFFFRAPPQAVESLAALGVRAVSLANNHALDFGEQALEDTIGTLERAGVAVAGAGRGPDAARQGAVVQVAGTSIGLLAITDHPAEYAARAGRLGVAQARMSSGLPEWVVRELDRLHHCADLVIAFPHWGPNMTTSPAGWQPERARELLSAGAGLVAGHSAHLFHGVGRHEGGFAAYDLGDALDDYAIDDAQRNDLGLLCLWHPGGDRELELVGLRLHYAYTELASGADADWIAARLGATCPELGSEVIRLTENRFTVQ